MQPNDRRDSIMAQRKGYNVTAFDIEGRVILSEHNTRKTDAARTSKEFLLYTNVYTVDVDDAQYGDSGNLVGRYIKTSAHQGVYVSNGIVRRVFFGF